MVDIGKSSKGTQLTDSDDADFDESEGSRWETEHDDNATTMLKNGVLLRAHPPTACAGRHCWVHNAMPSIMVNWPVRWRADKSTAERVCQHGIGHPDIDDVAYNQSLGRDVSIHGCDGCCGQ